MNVKRIFCRLEGSSRQSGWEPVDGCGSEVLLFLKRVEPHLASIQVNEAQNQNGGPRWLRFS